MWSSAISYEAKVFAANVRESLEKLEYVFVRDVTTKSYSRFVVMIPMMGGAHVFRYTVEYPSRFVIQCYDTYPSTKAGLMPFLEIEPVNDKNKGNIRRLLDEVVSRFNRLPWEFTTGQRLMVGYHLPEFSRSRRAWAEFGFDASRKASRERKKKSREAKTRERDENMKGSDPGQKNIGDETTQADSSGEAEEIESSH